MSYFLFGTFDTLNSKNVMQYAKEYGKERDIYLLFNEEIGFYEEIQRMLTEQKSEGKIRFAVTSKNQPYNSSDVLFPFDKFSNEELFADDTRNVYKNCCRNNISLLFECLEKIINSNEVCKIEIFVVEGYDDAFERKSCNLGELKEDILLQIEENISIDSCIYCID